MSDQPHTLQVLSRGNWCDVDQPMDHEQALADTLRLWPEVDSVAVWMGLRKTWFRLQPGTDEQPTEDAS